MSEYIESDSIDIAEAPRQQGPSLGEILSRLGGLASKGTMLAYQGIHQAATSAHEFHQELSDAQKLSFQHARTLVSSAPTSRAALEKLAAADPSLRILNEEETPLIARIRTLVANNDKEGVMDLSNELLSARQTRMQASVVNVAMEACSAVGFTPSRGSGSSEILVAKEPGSQKKISLSIEKDREGGVRLHCDLDGFNGYGCTETYEALKKELGLRGVSFRENTRRRKDRGGAHDARRLRGGTSNKIR